MTRIILHVGFHKTGTSSIQGFFRRNSERLSHHLLFVSMEDIHETAVAARLYSLRPFPWRRRRLVAAANALVASLPDGKTILISREQLSGAMLGASNIFGRRKTNYTRLAKEIGRILVDALRARFGPETQIDFYYSLRETESWMQSLYGHLLSSGRLKDDYDRFRKRFSDMPDAESQAREIAAHAGAHAIHISYLHDSKDLPQGPATPLLDVLKIPHHLREKLGPGRVENVGMTAQMRSEFLALNRKFLSARTLHRTKKKIRKGNRNSGSKT